ncbi:hypothetical protein ACVITL_002540 [Rhizobium pisi]|uniref:hypothetical protein n=1 Tax=Rhizobium pisi TaxID=574561 RepID=UPI0039B00F03
MCFALTGCYYLFMSGVEGSYSATGAPLLGRVTSRDEQTGGTLEIGSAEKQQCKGWYRLSQVKTNRWKLETGERTYQGRIYCVDGREGEIEFTSADRGRTGSISGKISGEAFQVNLIKPKKSHCDTEECRWGFKWTNENELSDSPYWKGGANRQLSSADQ